jgi:hypothetical protein
MEKSLGLPINPSDESVIPAVSIGWVGRKAF